MKLSTFNNNTTAEY